MQCCIAIYFSHPLQLGDPIRAQQVLVDGAARFPFKGYVSAMARFLALTAGDGAKVKIDQAFRQVLKAEMSPDDRHAVLKEMVDFEEDFGGDVRQCEILYFFATYAQG
jgi:hypothetical protein